ncbi:SpaA isopeptide-forming pilin-related protein [Exiguobacterium sp. s161]|uniref:SpaA isopeptide-forming pilin-related protein n=1 Tax=Exiguobacterium sp. s161 TaxID=2751191 RepID=UPI001BEA1F94|nr:SpaA isopeptide-forming pilin-related protein [Exiguobacterium sp. s161]
MRVWLSMILAVFLVLQPFATTGLVYATGDTPTASTELTPDVQEPEGTSSENQETESETTVPATEEASSNQTTSEEPAAEGSSSDTPSATSPSAEKKEETSDEPAATEESSETPSNAKMLASESPTNDKIMVITENILNDYTIKTTTKTDDEVNVVTTDSLVEIQYDWSIPDGHKYTDGSTFSFQIPKELKIYEVIKDQSLKFRDDSLGKDVSLGTFNVDFNGNATVTFNEKINEYSEIRGKLTVLTQVKETVSISEEKTITITPIVGKVSKDIRVALKNPGKDIAKSGIANRVYNPNSIKWSVELNKGLKDITNAVWTDPLPAGLKLDTDSIRIERLVLKMDGTIDQVVDVTKDYTVETTGAIRIDFKTMKNAYRISFDTTIENEEAASFKNETALTGDGLSNITASATVAIGRGVELDKKAIDYDDTEQIITWSADINYRQRDLSSLVVTDDFTNTHELLDEVKLYEIELNADGKESKRTEVPITSSPRSDTETNGFTLTLPKNGTAYQLVYQTRAIDRLFASGTVSNTISVNGLTDKADQSVGQAVLRKSHSTPNYATETIGWKIELNRDKKDMQNVVLTDDFTNEGLTYIPGSLKVSGMSETDYTLTPTTNGFILTFINPVKEKYEITYQTAFDYQKRADKNKAYLENEATVEFKDLKGADRQIKVADRVTLSSYSSNNGFKGGTYNAIQKEITWTLGVNYHEYATDALTVTDTWQGEQKLLEPSFKVSKLVRGAGANEYTATQTIPASAYTVTFEKGKFVLTFNEKTSDAYVITYKTSIDGTFVQSEYENRALVTDDKTLLGDLKARVSVKHGGEYADKSGQQTGKLIAWQVKLNYGQSTLRNVVVTDLPSNNQDVLIDSVKVYQTSVATDGTVSKGTLLSKDAYTVTQEDEMGKFTLAFKDEITRPYIIEYDSFIVAAVGASITNEVTFTADSLSEGVTTKKTSIIVEKTSGMATASGETGTLTIKKTDESGTKMLEGATFELIDAESGRTVRKGTTNGQGTLTFSRLLYGDYKLHETSAPSGYVIDPLKKETPIKISKPESNQTITNKKVRQDVTLIKKSKKTNQPLAGAEFTLYDSNNTAIRTNLVTDANGSLTVEDLLPGTYSFVETKAPAGHLLDPAKQSFTIVKDQVTAKSLTVTNQAFKSIQITKVDDVTQAPLADTTFKLVDSANQTIRENLKTDANGTLLIEDLDLGDYRLIETKASDGYILLGLGKSFSIKLDSPDVQQLQITNEKQKEVRLTKVDDQTKTPLQGAEFSLYDAANNEIRTGLVTGADGTVLVTKLNPGTYHFVETKAPNGYLLNTTRQAVTVTTGQRTPSLITVENERKKSVRLIKTDAMTGQPLADAVFSLLDGQGNILQTNLKTNTSGEILVTNLVPGTYRFVETSAPGGYMTDGTPYVFTLVRGNNDTAIVRATNDTFKSVRLTKIDALSSARLMGAEFSLINASGTILRTGLVTDVNGEVYVSGLVPGDYAFIETKAPNGYLLDSKQHVFTVSSRQSVSTLVTVKNEQKKAVRLLKTDATNGKRLAGTEFTLQKSTGEIIKEKLVTDTNGEIYVNELLPGKYAFIETKAVEGYQLDATPRPFTLSTGTNEVVTIEMTNDTFKSIRLIKKDGTDESLLSGAEFKLLDSNERTVRDRLVTNDSGEILVTGLTPGTYRFIETKAPAGYELDTTPHDVVIDKNQADMEQLILFNERLKTLIVQKVDDESGEALKDATFELQDAQGKRVTRVTTNEKGEARISNLVSGEYTLIETQAPVGYLLDSEPRTIRLKSGGEAVVRVTITNTIDPDYEFEDEDTPGGSGDPKDPSNPKDTTQPDDPKTPHKPNGGTDTPNDDGTRPSNSSGLPQTGESEPFSTQPIGFLLAAFGILLLSLNRRKKSQREG